MKPLLLALLLAGCAQKHKPSPSHQLVIPPECFQSMSCKGDIVVRDGHAYCGTWALKYTCTKVVPK